MTTICIKYGLDGNIVIGSDRTTSLHNNTNIYRNTPKWNKLGDIWIAISGPLALWPYIERVGHLAIKSAAERGEADLADIIRGAAEEAGIDTKSKDKEIFYGILVVPSVGIWRFSHDIVALRIAKGEFWAIGSGTDYAYGAGHAVAAMGGTDRESVYHALTAACQYDPSSGNGMDMYIIDYIDGSVIGAEGSSA